MCVCNDGVIEEWGQLFIALQAKFIYKKWNQYVSLNLKS